MVFKSVTLENFREVRATVKSEFWGLQGLEALKLKSSGYGSQRKTSQNLRAKLDEFSDLKSM